MLELRRGDSMNNLNRGKEISLSQFIVLINSICKGKIIIYTSENQSKGKVYCVDILDHIKLSTELRLFPYQEIILNRMMDKRYCAIINKSDLEKIPNKPNVTIERGN